MESTLRNMILSLFGITLVASLAVGGVYQVTKEPISEAKERAVRVALEQVLPPFESSDMEAVVVDDLPLEIYTATNGGEVVGYAVKSATKSGYSGFIEMMVGLTPTGELYNVEVLTQSETPGLGAEITQSDNVIIESIKDKNLFDFELKTKKDGGEVDVLTGATITTRAYCDGVQRAFKSVESKLEKGDDNE